MTGPTSGIRRSEVVSTIVVLVLAALAVFLIWPGRAGTPAQSPEAGSTAPATEPSTGGVPCPGPTGAPPTGPLTGITVPCLGHDVPVDLGAVLAKRPTLINVWASWCAPCRDELPALDSYARRPDAITVLTVDVQDDPAAALALLGELGVELPAVTDPQGALRAALDIPPALPASYVVRYDGTVVRVDPPTPFRTPDEVAATVARLS